MDRKLKNMKYLIIALAFVFISGTVIYQAVRHDTTMTGEGITGSELKVDTTVISTKANVLVVGVRKTGAVTETIDGIKTFSSDPLIPDEAYTSSWNGVLEPTTKNAVFDIVEATNFNSNIAIYSALGSSIKAVTFGTIGYPVLSNTLTDGQARYVAVYVSKPMTVTGVTWWQTVQGSYVADQNNYIGLYSYSGGTMTQVAISANDGNLWKGGSNTWQTTAFSSPYSLTTPGIYFVGFVYNTSAPTTAPTIGGSNNLLSTTMASIGFSDSAKFSGSVSAQNTLPATQAMSGVTGIVGVPFFGLY